MSNVWRLRMKSGKVGIDHRSARTFAFNEGWVGAGWGLDGSVYSEAIPDRSGDMAAYAACAEAIHDDRNSFRRALNAIGVAMTEGDHCWAYDSHTGEYWCCKVTGAFQYRQGGGV